eukprot:TRINITY_DN7501_c0_g1_i2.p2 TRINITY_DN7501_c0_g1~~TRINITY_DN7501_c0_g1_i2.p2  ORF type:complete len:126 (-),score=44.20 TRINITY_DN7501_c0_g1_i2:301-678(-)
MATQQGDDEVEEEQIERKQKKKQARPVRRVIVRVCDMPEKLKEDVIEYANQALDDKPKLHKDIAQHIKKQLDENYKGTWHCIVGTHFGSNITHDALSIINFTVDTLSFLVFRNGPPEKVDMHLST